jgi:SAM-dependent methyltransferase
MRNWQHMDAYLDELSQDVYSQPVDRGHTGMIWDVFYKWIQGLGFTSVLDVGCGANAVAQSFFLGKEYTGISLGDDAILAQGQGKNVLDMDMSFMDFPEDSFDLVWCRHTFEHSPVPLLTLMEFHRVAKTWLCLIVPNPNRFTWAGRNHYSVTEPRQLVWLLRRAGWKPEKIELNSEEFRFLCAKSPRVSYEGYAEAPLDHKIYAFERDDLLSYDGQTIIVAEALNKVRR